MDKEDPRFKRRGSESKTFTDLYSERGYGSSAPIAAEAEEELLYRQYEREDENFQRKFDADVEILNGHERIAQESDARHQETADRQFETARQIKIATFFAAGATVVLAAVAVLGRV